MVRDFFSIGGDKPRDSKDPSPKGRSILSLIAVYSKYFWATLSQILSMSAGQFFVMIDELWIIENPWNLEEKEKSSLESKADWENFLWQ